LLIELSNRQSDRVLACDNTGDQVSHNKLYLTGPRLDARYGISPMTRWRWEHDTELNFPQPTIINGRKYWCLEALEDWERARAPAKHLPPSTVDDTTVARPAQQARTCRCAAHPAPLAPSKRDGPKPQPDLRNEGEVSSDDPA
jgi:hypothetical protein